MSCDGVDVQLMVGSKAQSDPLFKHIAHIHLTGNGKVSGGSSIIVGSKNGWDLRRVNSPSDDVALCVISLDCLSCECVCLFLPACSRFVQRRALIQQGRETQWAK